MSAPPYMRFYWGDYFKDTRRLNRLEHSAYLLLLGEMWVQGGKLPVDDDALAEITLCTPAEWAEVKPAVMRYFKVSRGHLTQKRLAAELGKYSETVRKRKVAGQSGAAVTNEKRRRNGAANAEQLPSKSRHNQNQNHNKKPPNPLGKGEGGLFEGEGEQPAKADRRKPRSAIPDGFPDAEAIDQAQAKAREAGANVDMGYQAERFRNWAIGKDARYVDWPATWANWAARTIKEAPSVAGRAPMPAAVSGSFAGPSDLRADVVFATTEGFAVSWLDRCVWKPETRTLLAANPLAAETLRRDVGHVLKGHAVRVTTVGEEDQPTLLPFPSKGRAA